VFVYLYRLKLQKNCVLHSSQFDNDGAFLPHLATRQATVSDGQWRIFRVLSEHLKMTKKLKTSVLGHSLVINDKNCLYLYRFSANGYVFKTVERFLLVCSSMTAGCSVTLEFK